MKRYFLFLVFLLHATWLFSLSEMGQWETYLSYQNTKLIESTPQEIFAVADGHLYAVDITTGTQKAYSKMDGLSENTIQQMAYHNTLDVLVLVYANANIDLLFGTTVYNIPDVKDKNWSIDKTVYQIYLEEDRAYLACGFGIVVVDLTRKEIKDTYIVGENAQKVPVYGFTADEKHYYALSDQAIYVAPKNGANLLDFNVWHATTIELPAMSNCQTLHYVGESLLTIDEGKEVMRYQNAKWTSFYQGDTGKVSIHPSGTYTLITGGSKGVDVYKSDWTLDRHYNLYAEDALLQGNEVWFAVGSQGLGQYNQVAGLRLHKPSSIPNLPLKELSFSGDSLYVAHGGYWLDRFVNPCLIPSLKDGKWTLHTDASMQTSKWTDKVYDVTSVAVHPKVRDKFYFSTWGEGVFEVTQGVITNHFNESKTNGLFQSAIPGSDHYVRVDGLQFDKDGNLWVLNSYSGIKILDTQGNWHQLNYPVLAGCPALRHLLFTSKWTWCVDVRVKQGVFVFSHNGTLDDMSDDKYRFFGAGQFIDKDGNALSPNFVYDIDEGTDGTVWVATDIGPIVFSSVNKVFDKDYRCTRIKIPRNDGTGLADYLLDGVSIQTVAVDAGNRKWLGTADNGVFLLSPDGKETLLHFNTENSPLSSNEIVDIAIQELTGEVFFATADGLYSYRSDAMVAQKQATDATVYAFPNPVRPEYGGLITIAGLEADSKVWITDASANVVFEGESHGGSLSWDGRNASGQMVSGGVYFVLVSNGDSNQHRSVATKILIVR